MAHIRCSHCSEVKDIGKEKLPDTIAGRISFLREIGWDVWHDWADKRMRHFCCEKCKSMYQFKGRLTFNDLLLKTKRTD